jgi:hypothetical protein
MYYFYEVYDVFVSFFKKLVFGNGALKISLDVATFLDKRGSFEENENYSVIRVYYSRESLIYFPFYVLEKMFVLEVCRQYKFWACLFNE